MTTLPAFSGEFLDYVEREREKMDGELVLSGLPLSVKDWQQRDISPPEYLLGKWFTTTSKAILSAPTGLGKTNLILAAFAHMALGKNFLHWQVSRPCLVLYIDGEMSRRQLKVRIEDCARRLDLEGDDIPGLLALSHEDIPNWQPLNTDAGRVIFAKLLAEIEQRYGRKPDAICFDNVMSLVAGSMKDEEAWQEVVPLIQTLVAFEIGQVWIHHTGHDTTKGYGTKTREWLLDTCILLQKAERPDTDVSFSFEFTKARERTPEARLDFEEATIALVNDQWVGSGKTVKRDKLSPSNKKFLDALTDVFADGRTETFGSRKVATVKEWFAECQRKSLIEGDGKSSWAWFNKNKRELIEKNHIVVQDNKYAWKL